MINTATQDWGGVISLWPSSAALASDAHVSVITARSWRRRGIPGRYWKTISAAAARRGIAGVTVERLAQLGAIHHRQPPRCRAKAA